MNEIILLEEVEKHGPKLCIYDFDSPVFAASSVLQTNDIEVTYTPSGSKRTFANVTAFYGHWKKKEGGWLGEINKQRIVDGKDPFPIADFEIEKRSYVSEKDEVAHKAIARQISSLGGQDWSGEIKFIIDGPGNFRNDVAFTQPYKANRPPKPIRWREVRDWFEEAYDGRYVLEEGQEADDAVAIYGWWAWRQCLKTGTSPAVLVHIDKDINQIPGWHMNYDTGLVYWISEFEALKNLWTQVLVGDSTDNIMGLPGVTEGMKERFGVKTKSVGAKTAEAILSGCKTEQEMVDAALWCYESWYTENPYVMEDGEEDSGVVKWQHLASETFQLVFLLHSRDKYPTLMDYMKEKELTYNGSHLLG